MSIAVIIFYILCILTPLLIAAIGFILFMGRGVLGATMKARMHGAPLLIKYRNDNRAGFVTGKYSANMVNTPKGRYIATKGSMIPFYNMRLGICTERSGASLPIKLLEKIRKLVKQGIRSYDEAIKAAPEIKKEIDALEKKDKRKAEVKDRLYFLNDLWASIGEVNNFFKYSLNPSLVNEHISNELEKKRGKQNINVIMWLVGLAGFVGVLGFIIWLLTGQGCPQCPDCTGAVNAALNSCKTAAETVATNSII